MKGLKQELTNMERHIRAYPGKKLVITKNGTGWKWYESNGHKCTYIPKSRRSYAEQLALKKYYEAKKQELMKLYKASETYLKTLKDIYQNHSSTQTFLEHPGYLELIQNTIQIADSPLSDWMNDSYPTNTSFPENLLFPTICGKKVRSKTEMYIANQLSFKQIPFHYEEALVLNGQTFYPDFTIRHPETGEIFYWEHFGKMDDLEYIKKKNKKMQMYNRFGIVEGINLIVTTETSENPIDIELVNLLIKHYF